jgi:hypothetical protein
MSRFVVLRCVTFSTRLVFMERREYVTTEESGQASDSTDGRYRANRTPCLLATKSEAESHMISLPNRERIGETTQPCWIRIRFHMITSDYIRIR